MALFAWLKTLPPIRGMYPNPSWGVMEGNGESTNLVSTVGTQVETIPHLSTPKWTIPATAV
jgi:hypothetical protein